MGGCFGLGCFLFVVGFLGALFVFIYRKIFLYHYLFAFIWNDYL